MITAIVIWASSLSVSNCPFTERSHHEECISFWYECTVSNKDEEFCWENMPDQLAELYVQEDYYHWFLDKETSRCEEKHGPEYCQESVL